MGHRPGYLEFRYAASSSDVTAMNRETGAMRISMVPVSTGVTAL